MTPLRRSLAMGAVCAPVGLAAGAYVAATAIGDGYGMFMLYAPLAAFLAGSACWWLLMARQTGPGWRRGAATGALASVVGHWLCWYAMMLGAWIEQLVTGVMPSAGQELSGPVYGLAHALVLTFWSLLFLGWATLPAGAVLGAWLARHQART